MRRFPTTFDTTVVIRWPTPNRLSIQIIWTGFDDLNGTVADQKLNLMLFN